MICYKTLFFNPNLFTINQQPMKFYLDGYSNHDVDEIARIVEAFGGKLSKPDDSTIIFSEPGLPITTNYARFHIQCLRDSIAVRQLQDLEKYRIPLIRQHAIENTVKKQFVKTEQDSYNAGYIKSKSLSKSKKIIQMSCNVNMNKTSIEPVNPQLESQKHSLDVDGDSGNSGNHRNQRVNGEIDSAKDESLNVNTSSPLGKPSHRFSQSFERKRTDNILKLRNEGPTTQQENTKVTMQINIEKDLFKNE